MLNLYGAIFAIAVGANTLRGSISLDAFVDPMEQHDIEVRQRRISENVEIVNNTRLFLSAEISVLDEKAEVIQPHIGIKLIDVVPLLADDKLIGPQGSLLSGGWETKMSYDRPNGRNALVSVITPGLATGPELTPEETRLAAHLFARTFVDQYFVPTLNWACGYKLDSKEANRGHSGDDHRSQFTDLGATPRSRKNT